MLKVITNGDCLDFYPEVTPRHICARTVEDQKCPGRGDSGGGLIIKHPNVITPTLIGTLAYGPLDVYSKRCIFVFTRVNLYLDWIERISDLMFRNDIV